MRLFPTFLALCLCIAGVATDAESPDNVEKLAPGTFRVSLKEAVIITSKAKPDERLALLFTRFADEQAYYRWMYFNPLTADWVTGKGRVQEVYDKVKTGDRGVTVVAVPGHNTHIEAGGISLTWSRGNAQGSWIYFQPAQFDIRTIPADQFEKLE
jgi:hypothetical protein